MASQAGIILMLVRLFYSAMPSGKTCGRVRCKKYLGLAPVTGFWWHSLQDCALVPGIFAVGPAIINVRATEVNLAWPQVNENAGLSE